MRNMTLGFLRQNRFESHWARAPPVNFGSTRVPFKHTVVVVVEIFVVYKLGLLTLRLFEINETVEFVLVFKMAELVFARAVSGVDSRFFG